MIRLIHAKAHDKHPATEAMAKEPGHFRRHRLWRPAEQLASIMACFYRFWALLPAFRAGLHHQRPDGHQSRPRPPQKRHQPIISGTFTLRLSWAIILEHELINEWRRARLHWNQQANSYLIQSSQLITYQSYFPKSSWSVFSNTRKSSKSRQAVCELPKFSEWVIGINRKFSF